MRWVIVLSAIPLFVYGVVNVISPRTTMRWQRTSTDRVSSGDLRRAIGESFQRLVVADSEDRTLHRLRMLGLVEIAAAASIAAAALAML